MTAALERQPALVELSEAHLDGATALSGALGWPHRREDWSLMRCVGHGVAAVEADGTLVGTALRWSYGARAATVGLVIVATSRQRQGLGRRLMDAVLADAGSAAVMLNATAAGAPLYRAMGFEPTGIIRQYQGALDQGAAAGDAALSPSSDLLVRRGDAGDHAAIMRLDEQAFGAPRRALFDALLDDAEIAMLGAPGADAGYAVRRRFGRGLLIGPVVAPDEAAAMALIGYWLDRSEGFVRIDVPADADHLGALLRRAGLAPVGDAVTMVRGDWPVRAPSARTFALASQALG